MNKDVVMVLVAVAAGLFVISLISGFFFIRVWIQGMLSGVKVTLLDVVGMRLRGNPAGNIINAAIILHSREVDVTVAEIEGAYLRNKMHNPSVSELVDLVEAEKKAKA